MDVFSVLNAMNQFTELIDKPPVELDASACVNERHIQAHCDRCTSACPTDALEWVDGHITLAVDRCVRCGYCVHACPTGAITGQTDSDRLLQRIPQTQYIELACPYRPSPEGKTNPQAELTITPRCLAALSVSTYVELANQGITQITVRADACANCPVGTLAQQIHETADSASQLTPTMNINVVSDSPPPTETPPMVRNTNRTAMSRRGLFQMFTGEPPPAEPAPSTTPETSSVLPAERQRLLTALSAHSGEMPAWAPSLQVTGTCTACEVCVNICPMDALELKKGKTQFELELNPAHCTDCGLCVTACPEDVLQHSETRLPSDQRTTLTNGELRQCQRCKVAFSGDTDLCPTCAFRRQNPFGSSMFNAKGLDIYDKQ